MTVICTPSNAFYFDVKNFYVFICFYSVFYFGTFNLLNLQGLFFNLFKNFHIDDDCLAYIDGNYEHYDDNDEESDQDYEDFDDCVDYDDCDDDGDNKDGLSNLLIDLDDNHNDNHF